MDLKLAKQIFDEVLSGEPLEQDVVIEAIKAAQRDAIIIAFEYFIRSVRIKGIVNKKDNPLQPIQPTFEINKNYILMTKDKLLSKI